MRETRCQNVVCFISSGRFLRVEFIYINLHTVCVCVAGVGVEDDAVDAEVIADLQNRIKETQKDIQVNLVRDATVEYIGSCLQRAA